VNLKSFKFAPAAILMPPHQNGGGGEQKDMTHIHSIKAKNF